jgi:hypothetical protein
MDLRAEPPGCEATDQSYGLLGIETVCPLVIPANSLTGNITACAISPACRIAT